jgi:hypothetical protein
MPGLGLGHNAYVVALELEHIGAATMPKVTSVTRHYTALLKTRVQGKASGRPGPRIIKGDYRRSIDSRDVMTVAGPEGIVGTNKPQGRRLELGFVGVDALGRYYNQPPYPHFGPALWEIAEPYAAAVAAVIG